jgi:hypothetical protein
LQIFANIKNATPIFMLESLIFSNNPILIPYKYLFFNEYIFSKNTWEFIVYNFMKIFENFGAGFQQNLNLPIEELIGVIPITVSPIIYIIGSIGSMLVAFIIGYRWQLLTGAVVMVLVASLIMYVIGMMPSFLFYPILIFTVLYLVWRIFSGEE